MSRLFVVAIIVFVVAGCRGPKVTRTDTETSGVARIAIDETVSPVIDQQLAVFTGLNPEATIEPVYTGDRETVRLLMADSVRLIVTTRELSEAQKDSLKERKLRPRSQRLACDGIALIVNPANPDSLMSLAMLRDIMSGKVTRWMHNDGEIRVVFDNPNSSTLRLVRDSVMRGEAFSSSLRALENNREVVRYVAENRDALGVVGVSWIKDPDDPSQLNFDPTVRVVAIDDVKPYPAFLNNGTYPLRRDIFIIISDTYGTLSSGFVKFAASDAGQRIVLKAGLVPGTRPNREIVITQE